MTTRLKFIHELQNRSQDLQTELASQQEYVQILNECPIKSDAVDLLTKRAEIKIEEINQHLDRIAADVATVENQSDHEYHVKSMATLKRVCATYDRANRYWKTA